MCQFVALLNEKWGPAEGAKPKLRLVGGTDVKKTTVERQESWTGVRPLEKYSKTIKAATRRA
jgi:hypothetical protein